MRNLIEGLLALLCLAAGALFFMLFLDGCSMVNRDYLYKPTTIERGLNPKVILDNMPTEFVKADGIPLTDVDVVTFLNDVRQSWMKREQFVGGLAIGGAVSTEAVTAISGLADMSAKLLLPIVALGKFITGALGSAGTAEREAAYKGGLALLSSAWVEYVDSIGLNPDICDPADCVEETRISGRLLTAGARVLNRRVEAARVVTDKALVNQPATKEEITAATANPPKEPKPVVGP